MSYKTYPLLSFLLWLPCITGLALLILKSHKRTIAKFISLLSIFVSIWLMIFITMHFDTTNSNMQFIEEVPWFKDYKINYALGIDGISWPLIMLTIIINFIVIISAWQKDNLPQYLGLFFLLQSFMTGVFTATDTFLFYIFFEAMLIPMFFIIGKWGGERRIYAAMKFFLYTFVGSVLFLIAIIYISNLASNHINKPFSITELNLPLFVNTLDLYSQKLIFWLMFFAFAIKIPMWPVHTWLPDAHVEAPTEGSVVLAAVMLKIGGYGFLRFLLPLVPQAVLAYSDFIIALSLIAIVYVGIITIMQEDLKKLIAYSSIAHMGFVTLACVLGGVHAAMMQMISHGIISAALFLCVGVLYKRVHSKEIKDYSGLAHSMPKFAGILLFFALANAGLPGTSGFVGEFLVIILSMQANIYYAVIAASTMVLSAIYMLWMYKRVAFGREHNKIIMDKYLAWHEQLPLMLLVTFALLFGLWPQSLFYLVTSSRGVGL